MTDTSHDSRSIRHQQNHAAQGDLLAGYQLYLSWLEGKLGAELNPQRAAQQLNILKKEAQSAHFVLNKLSLHNFRRYGHLDIEFDKKLTVIVGENGAGKTSIIDAIATLLSWFASRFIKANNRGSHITDSDIHTAASDYALIEGSFQLNSSTPFAVSLVRPVAGWAGDVTSELQATPMVGGLYRLLTQDGSTQELPVFACYPVERSGFSTPAAPKESRLSGLFSQRFSAYSNIVREPAQLGRFLEQYLILSNLADSNNSEHSQQLQLVNQAIEAAVPHVANLHIDRSSGKAELKLDSFGNRLNFAQLSQGQKILAVTVGDLAVRMMGLNPHMDNPLQAQGIVLIDEIDLHLHPGLQQKILPGLQATFPGLQWIMSTHSPHVLSTVNASCIRRIEFDGHEATATNPEFQTKGVISADVLEQIMGTHAVPDVAESAWVTEYQSLIQNYQWDTDEGRSLHRQLLKHFGAHHPVMEDLDGQIRLAQLKQKYADRKKESGRA